MKAQDLRVAIRYFYPRRPLEHAQLNYWFIERQDTPRFRVEEFLISQSDPVKLLFIGPRGSGKTTELNKLTTEVAGQFHAVHVSTAEVTGRPDMNYIDLMRAINTQLVRQAIDRNLLPEPLSGPVRRRLEDLYAWWSRAVAGMDAYPPNSELSLHAKLNLLMLDIEAGVKQSDLTRDQVNRQLDLRMRELIDRLNWITGEIEGRSNRRLLVLVEELDKIDQAAALTIFRDRAATITAPRAATIFTFPNALRFSHDFDTIRRNFDKEEVFPNFALCRPDNSSDPEAERKLGELVLARLEERLIDGDALDLLIQASGGQLTSLIALVQNAATEAQARRGPPERITAMDARQSVTLLRRALVGPLSRQDYATLLARLMITG